MKKSSFSRARNRLPLTAWLLAVLGGLAAQAPAQDGSAPNRLTLQRLYSSPSLIGTAPRSPVFSADGEHLAFLWNDEGERRLDVWTTSVASPAIRRRTHLGSDEGARWVLWHPDGASLLVGLADQVLLVDEENGVRPLTLPGQGVSRPAIRPGGQELIFLRNGDLWSLSLADPGEAASASRLTSLNRPSLAVESFRLSPDGQHVALAESDSRRVPRRHLPDLLGEDPRLTPFTRAFPGDPTPSRRLGLVKLDSGESAAPRWLEWAEDPQDNLYDYRFSPDGSRLLIDSGGPLARRRHVQAAQVDGGQMTTWWRHHDPDGVHIYPLWPVRWSPDGQSIYVVADLGWDYHIHHISSPGTPLQAVTQGEWAVLSFEVFPQGIYLVANKDRPQERRLFKTGLQGGPVEAVSLRPGTHQPLFGPHGKSAAVTFSSDEHPPDLYLQRLASAPYPAPDPARRLTRSPLPEFQRYRWVQPNYVTFTSHLDGETLRGRLSLPPDFDAERRYPVIVGSVYSDTVRNQWGGRTAHPTWGLDQYLLQKGYILLNVNVRGSWGQGKEFRRKLRGDYGGIDVDDLHSAVLYLRSLDYVDSRRIGIWGSSYGGLMTCMALFRKPGLFRAGVAGAPATNVWHAFPSQMWVMGHPQDNEEAFADSSAFTHAAGLQDSLLIIHGMRDGVVLYQDSVRLVQKLIDAGKDVEMVSLPDAGHGWDNENLPQTRFAFRRLVEFFDRHLRPSQR